jgi:hypothetical protein
LACPDRRLSTEAAGLTQGASVREETGAWRGVPAGFPVRASASSAVIQPADQKVGSYTCYTAAYQFFFPRASKR